MNEDREVLGLSRRAGALTAPSEGRAARPQRTRGETSAQERLGQQPRQQQRARAAEGRELRNKRVDYSTASSTAAYDSPRPEHGLSGDVHTEPSSFTLMSPASKPILFSSPPFERRTTWRCRYLARGLQRLAVTHQVQLVRLALQRWRQAARQPPPHSLLDFLRITSSLKQNR